MDAKSLVVVRAAFLHSQRTCRKAQSVCSVAPEPLPYCVLPLEFELFVDLQGHCKIQIKHQVLLHSILSFSVASSR